MSSLTYRRAASQYLLDWACAGTHGRNEFDPGYKIVTENRDGPDAKTRARYSSCADLAHWLLFRLGCREPWINRAEHHGWQSGVNLNRLVPKPIGACPVASHQIGALAPGDIVVVDSQYGGHVICVTDVEDTRIKTAEYGQPGGMLKVRSLPLPKVLSHISLGDVPWTEEPDLEVLNEWLTGEELDALEALR